MAKTALAAKHAELGAQLIEQVGWEMTAHYGDLNQEYQAVRNGAGLVDLSNRGRIEITGKNRVQFLQGLVSNDVKALKAGEGVFAAFLNVGGRTLSDCFIYVNNESLLIDTPPTTREKIYHNLEKFSPAGEFNVTDLTEATSLLSLQGAKSTAILAKLGSAEIKELAELHLLECKIAERKLIVIRNSRTGEVGYDLLIANENITPIFDMIVTAGAKPVGLTAFNILRLEAGMLEYGVDLDENIILLEAGLERAVSYTKGCYLGQETIAKIHHRGKDQTAKRIAGLIVQGEHVPPSGAKIFNKDNREVGQITSAVFSPTLKQPIGLAYLKRDNFTPGTTHTVEIDGAKVSAIVTALPFYQGKNS